MTHLQHQTGFAFVVEKITIRRQHGTMRFHRINSVLSIDLEDLAFASAVEAITSRGPSSAFAAQIQHMLSPNNPNRLIWRNEGPGRMGELLRSFSNIHGRALARAYLHKYENVLFMDSVCRELRGELESGGIYFSKSHKDIHYPDWFGELRGSGKGGMKYVVAEAKGFYRHNWAYIIPVWLQSQRRSNYAVPLPVSSGLDQVLNCRLRCKNGNLIPFVGIVVASRWATEHNSLMPKLWVVEVLTL